MKNTQVIKIDKAVPMPVNGVTGLSALMRAMNVGDSFLWPVRKRGSVFPTAQRLGIGATTRLVSDTEIRVWRVK